MRRQNGGGFGKTLVFAPHPDDAEYGLGATIVKYGGKNFHVAIACPGGYPGVSSQCREMEASHAAERLGFSVSFMYLSEACQLNRADYFECVRKIEQKIHTIQPDTVFIPLPSVHQDHEALYKMCMTAYRLGKVRREAVYAYEYPNSNWGVGVVGGEIQGRLYVEVSPEELVEKGIALKKYESQNLMEFRDLARVRGAEAGVEYAELFYLLRAVM